MTKTIFCDESGFDGNNLLAEDQPYFVFSAVEISEQDAKTLVESVRTQFSIRGPEIHTSRLLKTDNGRAAVNKILEHVAGRSRVVYYDKQFSLCCKFFEYLVEPIVQDAGSYFYEQGFHKFIANALYFATKADGTRTPLLTGFQGLMRGCNRTDLKTYVDTFAATTQSDQSLLANIAAILICNLTKIQEEIRIIESNNGISQWILDLSVTAIRSLLAEASGRSMVELLVTCDDSKPLKHATTFFDAMHGRTDYHEIRFDDLPGQLTFNLSRPLLFLSSRTSFGVQIADVIASSAAYALKKPMDKFSVDWRRQYYFRTVHYESVIPDIEAMDLSTVKAVKNSMLLTEMKDRSVRGRSLIADLKGLDQMVTLAANGYMAS